MRVIVQFYGEVMNSQHLPTCVTATGVPSNIVVRLHSEGGTIVGVPPVREMCMAGLPSKISIEKNKTTDTAWHLTGGGCVRLQVMEHGYSSELFRALLWRVNPLSLKTARAADPRVYSRATD